LKSKTLRLGDGQTLDRDALLKAISDDWISALASPS
jgi:hypothetical protein